MRNSEWTRRAFLKAASFTAAGLTVTSVGCAQKKTFNPASTSKPNVILIITDDQGYGDLACHGNEVIKTPNLDKLHSDGVRLTDFHVGPTCAPTRAALLTGRYCNRTGVWHTIMGRSQLRKDEVTLGDVFRDGGYKTGIFGKWHLGDNYPFRPQDRGFDEVLIHGAGGVGQTPDYWGNDYFDDTYFHNGNPEKFDGYCTDIWFDGAMGFIRKNKNKPFFAYLTTNAPHGPFLVSEEYENMYRGKENVPNPAFYGMITNIDDNMARLRKMLKDEGLQDNTILIFMTDNGTSAGIQNGIGYNASMRGRKSSEYEGGHRVPCFIYWPDGGMVGGRDVEELTAHIDMMPTLMDICGIKKRRGVELDGNNILPLLNGDPSDRLWKERVLVTDSQRVLHPIKWRKSAVMKDKLRLVNGKELYDIKTDPGQDRDISAEHPEIVKNLRREYDKWWKSVSTRFDEYTRTIVGTEHQNPVTITAHDWLNDSAEKSWNQGHIQSGSMANGPWLIDVARAGKYKISLRRWPKEANAPITGKPANDKKSTAINVNAARLKIGDFDIKKKLRKNAKVVNFVVDLKAGHKTLQTWFIDERTKKSRGAFYVYVEYMG